MMSRIRNRIKAAKFKNRERFEQWAARNIVRLAAVPGTLRLKRDKPLRVLIDNSVLRLGLTHTNAWISTGTKLWGGSIPVETGYRARVARSYPPSQAALYEQEVPFFAPLAHLAGLNYIRLFTSKHLQIERFRQPSYNRFRYGLNVWTKVHLGLLPSIPSSNAISYDIMAGWSNANAQAKILLREADPGFLDLIRHVDQKHILDFYHLWAAKHGNCPVFLTCDKKLLRVVPTFP
jgi:hypothetical protein